MTAPTIHATGLVLGGIGVLLRGPSGAGKSILALDLLETWALRGRPAALVADDRIVLSVRQGHPVMHAPPALAGLIELRGRGIVTRPFVEAANLHLVVDLVDTLVRMPEAQDLTTTIAGCRVARCPVPRAGLVDQRHQLLLIGEAMRQIGAPGGPDGEKMT